MGGANSGKPKGELLFLDGRELIDGKLTRTKFFDFLATDLSDYSDIVMTAEQALAFKNSVVRMTHGTSAAIPLYCRGPECINKVCPLHKTKEWYPIGRQCLVENRMIQYLMASYIEDLDVDIDSPTEMTLVNQLVEADIIDHRANLGLSGGKDQEAGELLLTNETSSDHGDSAISSETTVLHPLLEIKHKNNEKRLKILEALVGTRREKYKKAAALKTKDHDDASSHFAELKEKINSASRALDGKKQLATIESAASKILDADWTTEDGE